MQHLCRTCQGEITTNDFVSINDNNIKSTTVKSQLFTCIPELQQDLVKDPVLCSPCVSALHAAYTFKGQCLDTEEHIRKYFLKTKLSEKNVTFVELYKQVTRVSAACHSLKLEDSVVKSSQIVDGNEADEDDTNNIVVDEHELPFLEEDTYNTDEESISNSEIFSVNKYNNISSKDVDNITCNDELESEEIVKEEHSITQFKIEEDNFKDDVVLSDSELDKLSLLQLLDESLQNTRKRFKNSEECYVDFDLPPSQFGNVSKTTFSHTTSKNKYENTDVVSSINGIEQEYLQNKNLASNVITNSSTNVESSMKDIQRIDIQLKECFVKLVRIEDVPRLQSENVLKTTFLPTRRDLKSSLNGMEEETLKMKNSASKVIGIHTDKRYRCTVCKFHTSSQMSLKQHLRAHTGETPFRCNSCEFCTMQRGHLITHMRTHTGEKPFMCSICDYRATQRAHLKTHMNTHTKEKQFQCSICEFRTAFQGTLKSHMRTHTGEKPFQCNICEFRTTQRGYLKIHMRTHTGEKPFQCNICEFRTTQRGHLKTHMRTHTGEKPFQCNICEFRTARRSTLKTHRLCHTGEKPFQCNICEFRTKRQTSLKIHMRTHTGEKPFQCNICEFRTTQRGNLKSHMRTHTGEKPFVCSVCEFCTAKKLTLTNHMRTHSGEKPFRCTNCEFRTARQDQLKTHMRSHTGEKPFQCNICEFRTARRDRVKKHIRTHL